MKSSWGEAEWIRLVQGRNKANYDYDSDSDHECEREWEVRSGRIDALKVIRTASEARGPIQRPGFGECERPHEALMVRARALRLRF